MGLVGMGVYVLGAATFPHFPEVFANPHHDVTLRLLGDGLVAPNILGGVGFISVLPYVFMAFGLAVWAGRKVLGTKAVAIALAVAVGITILMRFAAPFTEPADRAYEQTVKPALTER